MRTTRLLRGAATLGAAAVALLAPAVASAAPVTVKLRIEGGSKTHFEGAVTTDVRLVNGNDGTGNHKCDGTNGGQGGAPGPTAGTALADGSTMTPGFTYLATWFDSFEDFLVESFNEERLEFPGDGTFWGFFVNGVASSKGMCQTKVLAGEEILFARVRGLNEVILELEGPATANRGERIEVKVTNAADEAPMAGAQVGDQVTSTDGSARLRLNQTGAQSFKATRPNAVRSNRLDICVHNGNDGTCGTTLPQADSGDGSGNTGTGQGGTGSGQGNDSTGTEQSANVNNQSRQPATSPPASSPSRSSELPRSSVTPSFSGSLARGARFSTRSAPRTLRGAVEIGDPGLRSVMLRIQRRHRGRCSYFSGRRRAFRSAMTCGAAWYFEVPAVQASTASASATWRYRLPHRLRPGRYMLDVLAIDALGRRSRLRRGKSRLVFQVRPTRRAQR